MSNRILERVTSAVVIAGEIIVEAFDVNVQEWGGTPVSPAAPKADGASNAINVPEIGARIQTYNGATWDLVRSGFQTLAAITGVPNSLPIAKFMATPTLVADTWSQLRADVGARLLVESEPTPNYYSGNAATGGVDGADAASGVISAVPATFYEAVIFNNSTDERFFQLFNTVAVPADGAFPFVGAVRLSSKTMASLTFTRGVRFSTGISWCSSSARLSKMVTLAADMSVTAESRT